MEKRWNDGQFCFERAWFVTMQAEISTKADILAEHTETATQSISVWFYKGF